MKKVRPGVIAADRLPALAVDRCGRLLAGLDRSFQKVAKVPCQTLDDRCRVQHADPTGRGRDRPGISNLAAGLRIEGSPIEEDFDQFGGIGSLLAVDVGKQVLDRARHHGQDPRFHVNFLVPEELRRAEFHPYLAPRGSDVLCRRGACPARLAGPSPLLLHRDVETATVDFDPPLPRDLFGQIDRKAVGVVELEGDFSPDSGPTSRQLRLEQRRPGPQRAQERLLLVHGNPLDEVPVALEFRVRAPHDVGHDVDDIGGDEAFGTETLSHEHGPADQPAKHVTAALVRREDTFRDQERERAGMVRDNAKPDVGLFGAPIDPARDSRRRIKDRCDEIGVEDRLDALDLREDPVEPGSGVDVPLGKLRERAVGVTVVLDEHEVPELDVALAPLGGPATGPVLGPPVEIDLRTWAAWARLAHLPEVVLVESLQSSREQARDVAPERFGLVVGDVDGDPEVLRIKTELPGEQLPRVGDRQVLEVVAETEVPEHLEEGHMTRRGSGHVDVDGAHARLHRRRPRRGRRSLGKEVRLELDHAGDREQHRRVVRHQARGREREMTTVDEELRERVAQLVRVHLSPRSSLTLCGCPCSLNLGRRAAPSSALRAPSRRHVPTVRSSGAP